MMREAASTGHLLRHIPSSGAVAVGVSPVGPSLPFQPGGSKTYMSRTFLAAMVARRLVDV